MDASEARKLAEEMAEHPALKRLFELASKLLGIDLLIVFPKSSGWVQASPHHSPDLPSFCKAIQQTREGARHCRMCHILMAVAACGNDGAASHTCHAGTSVLSVSMPAVDNIRYAILSSCTFAPGQEAGGEGKRWRALTARASKLGADPAALREAYEELPRLSEEQIVTAREIMAAVADVMNLLLAQHVAQRELAEMRQSKSGALQIREAVESGLRGSLSQRSRGPAASRKRRGFVPPVVRVVATLVKERPNMPFSVADIAAAARMSPNHFSALFHKYQEKSFSSYLTEHRIELSKMVLGDLTLNIAEVAQSVGYDDPGYFARRFKQKVGVTPSEWRDRIVS